MSGLSSKDRLLNACYFFDVNEINKISYTADLGIDQSYGLYFEKIFENRDLSNDQEKVVKVLRALINIFKSEPKFNLEDFNKQWIKAARLQDNYFSDLSPIASSAAFFSEDSIGSEYPDQKPVATHTLGKIEGLAIKIWQQAEPEINKLPEAPSAVATPAMKKW